MAKILNFKEAQDLKKRKFACMECGYDFFAVPSFNFSRIDCHICKKKKCCEWFGTTTAYCGGTGETLECTCSSIYFIETPNNMICSQCSNIINKNLL